MAKAVFDELRKRQPQNHFTIGIQDDVTHTSLGYDAGFSTESAKTMRAIFYGLGSDGTVSANKNSIKIIGKGTRNYAQGYFVYDSKKAGSVTVSHLRFGPEAIRSSYLIEQRQFHCLPPVHLSGTHGRAFQSRYGSDISSQRAFWSLRGLGSSAAQSAATDHREKASGFRHRRVFRRARSGHGRAHQHHHANLFLCDQRSSPKRPGHRGDQESHRGNLRQAGRAVLQKNFEAVDRTVERLFEVRVPQTVTAAFDILPPVPQMAPEFVRSVLGDNCRRPG